MQFQNIKLSNKNIPTISLKICLKKRQALNQLSYNFENYMMKKLIIAFYSVQIY